MNSVEFEKRVRLDERTRNAARSFLRQLEGRYPVQRGIVFGSRARGNHSSDSDADLAVILRGASGDRRAAAIDMAGTAFDVLMETGILVDALPLWEDELMRRLPFPNPALIDAIHRDGVPL